MYRIILNIDLLLSIVGYFCCPDRFSLPYCIIALFLYLVSFIILITHKIKKNFFTFEFIFSVVFFFVYYLYPVFGYLTSRYIYVFRFNENVITKCTYLATIGYNAFIIGLFKFYTFRTSSTKKIITYFAPTTSFVLVMGELICLVLTILQMFVFHANRYSGVGDSGIWGYIKILKSSFVFAALTIVFYKMYISEEKKIILSEFRLFFLMLAIESAIYAFSGYRGIPLGYILSFFAGVTLSWKGFSLKKMLLYMVLGIIILYSLMLLRSGLLDNFSFDIFKVASDLVTNNITSFICYDYVKSNGMVLFPLVGSLIQAIPFLLGYVVKTLKIPTFYVSSAEFLTYITTGKIASESVGLGTNIIASLYLSLGVWGVTIMMWIFGIFISSNKIDEDVPSINKFLIYEVIMSVSVYQVRSDFFYLASSLVWSFIMLNILMSVCCNTRRINIYD